MFPHKARGIPSYFLGSVPMLISANMKKYLSWELEIPKRLDLEIFIAYPDASSYYQRRPLSLSISNIEG